MRDNQPVTNREIMMHEDSLIVSRTDAKGLIRFVNKDFLEISGFTEEELIGKPHNIIRHPDMPSEAFEDMWRDIKNGLAWVGYVKNRCKNGDHYWVHANVTPIISNGTIEGFVSVRRKPDPAVITKVEEEYRQFREGKAKNLAIEHGAVVQRGFSATLKRRKERFANKLFMLTATLCMLLTAVGGVGMYNSSVITESLRTVYEDRLIPAGQLAGINQALYNDFLHLNIIATGQEREVTSLLGEIEQDSARTKRLWADYMATYLTPEEKVLAATYESEQQKFLSDVVEPAVALVKAGKLPELIVLLRKSHPQFDAVTDACNKLLDLQLRVAKEEYNTSKTHDYYGFWISVLTILIAVVIAIAKSKLLQAALVRRLAELDKLLASIASGNLKDPVNAGFDELQGSMVTIQTMQAKFLYSQLEKKQLEEEMKENRNKLAVEFERSVKAIVNLVAAASTELSQTARSMVGTIQDSNQKTSHAVDAATGTSANVQTVAAAAEELSASVKEISGQIQKTNQLVSQSHAKAENMDNLAGALTKASDKVSNAMEMISEIAGQVNLLALNATIEAARAGDAGKGFAVVASEVKNLASQTDKTVVDIHGVIDEMRNASRAIIASLSEIKGSVSSIAEATSSVASAVEEQSATTNEIAMNMQNAASATQSVTSNLKNVSEASQHASAAVEQMLQASQELSQQSEKLNDQVDAFLKKIKTA